MEMIKLKIIPHILYDKYSDSYTIYDANNGGGAIVSDVDKDIAMNKFKKGMQFSIAVKNFIEFKNTLGINNKWYVAEY